jgi:hypothetical protein
MNTANPDLAATLFSYRVGVEEDAKGHSTNECLRELIVVSLQHSTFFHYGKSSGEAIPA